METEKGPQAEELKTKVGQIVDRLIDLTEKGEIKWKGGYHISGAYTSHSGHVFVAFKTFEDWGIHSFLVYSEVSKELEVNCNEETFGHNESNPIGKLDNYLFPFRGESKVEEELGSPVNILEKEQVKNASQILESLK
jgi:hypothetical protein